MRGEQPIRPLHTMATLVDPEGQPRYYILPGKLVAVGLISMVMLFILAVMLALMVVKNKLDLDTLRQQVTVEDQRKDGTK